MTDKLIIGDYSYSSWSLRGWLLFEKFGLKKRVKMLDFHAAEVRDQMADYAPARTVPTVIFADGAMVWDSAAIAEELATRNPDAGIWPTDARARATARTLLSEMHSGFMALRSDCPMNLRTAYSDFEPSGAVLADVKRIEDIWAYARSQTTDPDQPWLLGAYSAVDAFFAPVAARIAGYNIPIGTDARTYVDAHLHDLAFRRFRAMGLCKGETLKRYYKTNATTTWPGPTPLLANPVANGPSENSVCPYSGDPVTDYLEIDGRVFGFCNQFCRDKTLGDPAAWPAFMALL